MSTVDLMEKAADLMVSRGLTVLESSGWQSRGRPYSFNPTAGVIAHHTGTEGDCDNVLINGRSDLPGPLCQWALHRDGKPVLIASGYANHAGESQPGAPSNSNGWGIEATGPVPVSAFGPSAFPNYDEYVIMVGCILEVQGWGTSKVFGHKESCSPSGRKIDPSFDMDAFRSAIAAGMKDGDNPLADLSQGDKDFFQGLFNGVHQDFVTLLRGETHASTQRILDKLSQIAVLVEGIEDAITGVLTALRASPPAALTSPTPSTGEDGVLGPPRPPSRPLGD